jgi:hypothetical protein
LKPPFGGNKVVKETGIVDNKAIGTSVENVGIRVGVNNTARAGGWSGISDSSVVGCRRGLKDIGADDRG